MQEAITAAQGRTGDDAVIIDLGGAEVTITSPWLTVKGNTKLTLRNGALVGENGGDVLRAIGAGVVLTFERLRVEGTVSVTRQAKARMVDVTITRSKGRGLYMFHGADVDLEGVVITGCKRGLFVGESSVVRVRGGRIAGCEEGGVHATKKGRVELERVELDGGPGAVLADEQGVVVRDGVVVADEALVRDPAPPAAPPVPTGDESGGVAPGEGAPVAMTYPIPPPPPPVYKPIPTPPRAPKPAPGRGPSRAPTKVSLRP